MRLAAIARPCRNPAAILLQARPRRLLGRPDHLNPTRTRLACRRISDGAEAATAQGSGQLRSCRYRDIRIHDIGLCYLGSL